VTAKPVAVRDSSRKAPHGTIPGSVLVALPLILVAAGAAAFAHQWQSGIGVTGKSRPVMWGFYITTFAFWCGAGAAGTLLAAWAQFSPRQWAREAGKPALATGLFALVTGALFPIIHLGRPETFYWLLPFTDARLLHPNPASPLLADLLALNAAILSGVLFLSLYLLPDAGRARDRSRGVPRFLWSVLVPGWISGRRGLVLRARLLPPAGLLASISALAVGWTISLDFFKTVNPLWNSPLFIPQFLAGCAYSGLAAVVLVLSVLGYAAATPLKRWLACAGATWFVLCAAESLRVSFGGSQAERTVLTARTLGAYSPLFWIMVCACIIIPAGLALARKLRSRAFTVPAMAGILAGMWLERFLIVVPTLANPRLSYARGGYQPTWTESTIVVASAGLYALMWLLLRTLVRMEDENAPV
jgi:Ni/Fe-hydrogenase subunit HybB-like protein